MKAICLPYAGGGTSAFARWAGSGQDVPLQVLAWAAKLPESNARGWMPRVVERIAREILETSAGPYVLVGASAGARVAYLVAEWICVHAPEYAPCGVTLLAPPVTGSGTGLELLLAADDVQLVRHLKQLGGIPTLDGVTDDMLALMVGSTRRQLELIAGDESLPRKQGGYRIRLALGIDDPLAPVGVCDSWLRALGTECEVSLWPGGHFFWKSDSSAYDFAVESS